MNKRKLTGWSLIAVGLIVLLFGAWNVWGEDAYLSFTQSRSAGEYHAAPDQSGSANGQRRFVDAAAATHLGDIFARVYVPRFGKKWVRLIGEGVKWHPVLNEIGVGHYPGTQLPGEVGNFAVAGHRGGYGGAFLNIHRLTQGDHVYVETNDGWFSYVYLQTKIVSPNDVAVLRPVPQELNDAVSGERYMTMTSCTPVFVNTKRIVVWLKLDNFRTAKQGPPPAIADSVVK